MLANGRRALALQILYGVLQFSIGDFRFSIDNFITNQLGFEPEKSRELHKTDFKLLT